ncbi:MAG: hypothetical protein Q8P12_04340, partial [bacterium]|nr:hypothetical protein [bacterium]
NGLGTEEWSLTYDTRERPPLEVPLAVRPGKEIEMSNYTPVATFPSSSSNKTYTVSEDEQGNLSCNCPAWTFKKGTARTCKHVQAVERGDVNREKPVPAKPTTEVAQAGVKEKGGSLADIFARMKKDE